MDREILVTYYVPDKGYTFEWLQDEDEAKEWLEENKDKEYRDIDIIKTRFIEQIYPL